jgi:hypothetical protein
VIAAPPPAALTAAPARIELAGAADEAIRVTNSGRFAAVLDARPAGFALDLRGRPHIVVQRDPATRIAVRPSRLTLAPGESASVTVSSALLPGARAGDHAALVLLTTRAQASGGVGVRVQIGVVVMVRVPGAVVHHLDVLGARVSRRRGTCVLEIALRNRGNVAERVGPRSLRVVLRRRGHARASLRPVARELLPGTRGIVAFRVPEWARGPAQLDVELPATRVRRAFRIQLGATARGR